MNFPELRASIQAWKARPAAQAAQRWVRRAFAAAVFAWLAWQIGQLGLGEVARSMPRQPGFYALYLATWLLIPTAGMLFFHSCWQIPLRSGFLACCRKHVYNQEVVDYAGELYFYSWARKHWGLTEREAFRAIKDNAIVSSIAASLIAFILPAVSLELGWLQAEQIPAWVRNSLYAGPPLILAAVGLMIVLRKWIFSLPVPMLLAGFAIHGTRTCIWLALMTLQWRLALPDEPMKFAWTMLVLMQFCGRIPAMPFRDGLFVAIGVGASQGMGGPAAQVAGILLVNSLLEKSINLTLYSTSLFQREALSQPRQEETGPPVPVDGHAASNTTSTKAA